MPLPLAAFAMPPVPLTTPATALRGQARVRLPRRPRDARPASASRASMALRGDARRKKDGADVGGAGGPAGGRPEKTPGEGDGGDEVPIEHVDGLVQNANVRPMLDVDADEGMLMYKLRKELGAEDFNRIFNPNDRRIGEVL